MSSLCTCSSLPDLAWVQSTKECKMRIGFFVFTALVLADDSAAVITTQGAMNSKVVPSDNELIDVSSTPEEKKKKALGSHKVVEDEERLAGANVFNVEKINMAMADAGYAQKLFERWRRHKYDDATAVKTLESMELQDPAKRSKLVKEFKLYLKQKDLNEDFWITKEMVDKALKDSDSAVAFFKLLKLYEFRPEHLVKYQAKLKLDRKKLLKLHAKYVNWHQLHHPADGMKTTLSSQHFLFERTRLKRAIEDRKFANTLFMKWKRAGFEKDRAFDELKRFGIGKRETARLRKRYAEWLGERPIRKSTFHRIGSFFERLYKGLASKE